MKPLLLVVDDDTDDIELFQGVLSKLQSPPDFQYFLDAESLLKFLRKKILAPLPPMAITLDINLPGMNGITLLKELKKEFRISHVPVYMITTSSSPQQKEICLKSGASHFYTKPVDITEWLKIVESIVRDIEVG